MVIIFRKIWESLGLSGYLGRYLENRRITFDAVEMIFAMVLMVVCFNKEQALRDKEKREEIIVRLLEKLKTQGLKSLLVHKEYSKYHYCPNVS